jgi:hypothetical protein
MNARTIVVRRVALAALVAAIAAPAGLRADVKTQEKTRVQFGGALGKMINFFGGKAAREGVTSTVALRGDRMLTTTDGNAGELVDLAEEKVYRIDFKKKEYQVVTFAEMRKQMEDAMRKAKEDTRETKEAEPGAKGEEPAKEYEVDFAIKDTGQSKAIAGLTATEVLATVTVREKGKTLEQAGGMVMETNMWMTPSAPGLKEIADFRMKYFQKVYGGLFDAQAQGMAQAMAMYPMMQDAMKRMQNESKNMNGTPLATDMRFILVAGAEQQQAAKESEKEEKSAPPTSIGGLIGGFGRKMAKKKDEPKADETPGRVTVMTSTTETLQINPSVADADVALPAGFKEKR